MTIAGLTLKLAILSLLLLLLGTAGARFDLFNYQVGLLMFSFAALLSFISICASALFTRRAKQDHVRKQLSKAALLALPAIIFFSINLFQGAGAPVIHDISTDLQNPPEFIKAPSLRTPTDNDLNFEAATIPLIQKAYPRLTTLTSLRPVVETQNRIYRIASEMGWLVYYQQEGHIEAQSSSFWFGFVDDIVIRIQPTQSGSKIDLRSASRVGKGDLGVNAKRIQTFSELFNSADLN